ncbi:MAG: hypothetical protein WBW80_14040, partial [Acidimicrobiales bacterium]
RCPALEATVRLGQVLPKGIEVEPVQDQPVPAVVPEDTVGTEQAAKSAGQHRNLFCRSRRREIAPETVDDPVDRHRATLAEGKDLEQGTDLAPTQLGGFTPFDLEIAQNPHSDVLHSIILTGERGPR